MKHSTILFSFLFMAASFCWAEAPIDPNKDVRAEPPGAPRTTPTTAPALEAGKSKAPAGPDTQPKIQISASYKKAIQELMHVTHADKNQEAIIEQIASNLSKDAKDPSKAKKTAYDFFYKVISVDALLQDIAETYAQYFSESELKKLVAFYKSPLGQKAASKMPEITKEMMMKNQLKMQFKMAEFNKEKASMEGFK